jgi:two-component system chemotaxis response regulator CheB
MKPKRIVVIGTSAGGLEALKTLVVQLPAQLPAAVFIVQHMAPNGTAEVLAEALSEKGPLPCVVAQGNELIRAGHIYVAPADSHMLLKRDRVIITKGARENRYRPAIDPLFRSAAVAYGTRVISVVLTGLLDDGTEGTAAVRRCGGVTIVQDPKDAAYADMPLSASHADVHHCVPLRQIGALIADLAKKAPPRRKSRIPTDVKTEAVIAERVLSDLNAVNRLGDQVPYNCPNCGGVLWSIEHSKTLRYRCHTGHSFTAATLLAEQSAKIEETLWITLRMLEERRNLLRTTRMRGQGTPSSRAREKDTEVHIDRIRTLLVSGLGKSMPRSHRKASA